MSNYPNEEIQIQCGGRCCDLFPLPMPPQDMLADYIKAIRGEHHRWEEIVQIFPMVVYVGTLDTSPWTGRKYDDGPQAFYTCKYLKPDGLCRIYDHRPWMCKAYPYGRACHICGCGGPSPVNPDGQLDKEVEKTT